MLFTMNNYLDLFMLSAIKYSYVLFEGIFSSSRYFGKVVLFYCGTPWPFHIIILLMLLKFVAL